jgi:RNA polymerase sigma-70 factor (ECF subfamily)
MTAESGTSVHRIPAERRHASDEALAACADAPGCAEILLRRYERKIRACARQMSGNTTDAEDLAQETFLKAFRGLAAYDPNRKFSSWLFRIAHNTALDALRRARTRVAAAAELEEVPVPPPPDPVEAAALGQALEAALARLRPEFRTAIVLRYQEGCSYEDIAGAMGIPEGTAKTFVHRARRQMAELLQAAGWGR